MYKSHRNIIHSSKVFDFPTYNFKQSLYLSLREQILSLLACENRKIMVDDVIESKLGSYVDIITIYTVICRKATEIQSETFVFDTCLTYFGRYSLQDLKYW